MVAKFQFLKRLIQQELPELKAMRNNQSSLILLVAQVFGVYLTTTNLL
jgi:hypothetical protein